MESVDDGIVGIITNHSFLDNPTLRGMRHSLMNTFDEMYFLDLHGNLKKKEKTPEGGKDENVFDIEQGVCIYIFIKSNNKQKKIYYSSLYGLREEKYNLCIESKISSIHWTEANPSKEYYLFNNSGDSIYEIEYLKFLSVSEIFENKSVGMVTSRDDFVIDFDKTNLVNRINTFISNNSSDDEIKNKFLKPADKLPIKKVKDIFNNINWKEQIYKCSYRPFDYRYIIYNKYLIDRIRSAVMDNMLQDNIAILFRRQFKHGTYSYILVSKYVTEARFMENAYSHVYVNPLYTFNKEQQSYIANSDKTENFTKDFRSFIDSKYKHHFSPEEILGYIYAVLHSPAYRKKYSEFLKIDFPRIPFTEDKKMFQKLSSLGWELIQIHLMNKESLNALPKNNIGNYTGTGDNEVKKVEYVFDSKIKKHRIKINPEQYFENVPEEIYNFYIGGYQVLYKYLKDRKGRTLTLDEIENVENIIKIISFTITQMENINTITKDWV